MLLSGYFTRVLDLDKLLALMAWFAFGEPQDDIPAMLRPTQSEYSFSDKYIHKNAARTEIFFANTGVSTAWLTIRFLGKSGREVSSNEIEINPLEFPYIYSGLDLVDRNNEEITVQVDVELENFEEGGRTDVEVYLRQMDDSQELGPDFQPFSTCKRLRGPSNKATWTDC